MAVCGQIYVCNAPECIAKDIYYYSSNQSRTKAIIYIFLNEQKSRDAAAKKYRYKRSRDK